MKAFFMVSKIIVCHGTNNKVEMKTIGNLVYQQVVLISEHVHHTILGARRYKNVVEY